MATMDADILAIGFYAGILFMAATVVVLTVIYITRPGSGIGIYDLQLWRKWDRSIKSPQMGQQSQDIPTYDMSPGQHPAVSERVEAGLPVPDQHPAVSERVDADSPAPGQHPAVSGRVEAGLPVPDQHPAVSERVEAGLPVPDQIIADSNTVERSESNTSMKIKFPMKQVKAEEKSQVLPDSKVMEKDVTALGVNQAATGNNSPPAPPSAAAGLPVVDGTRHPSPGVPAPGVLAPGPGSNGLPPEKHREADIAGQVKTEAPPAVAAKAANPAGPAAEASQVKPEASRAEPPHPGETASKEPRGQKASADDLSGLFASESVDDSETSKLADALDDVDINNLLLDGLDLVKKLKTNRG